MTTQRKNQITGQGGKSSASVQHYTNLPNSIRSQSRLRMLTVVSAGQIEGLASGQSSLRMDGVPVVSPNDGSSNISGVDWSLSTGSPEASDRIDPINAVENTQLVGHQLRHNSAHTRSGDGDAAKIILKFPNGLVKQSSHGIFGTNVEFKVDVRKPDGSWIKAGQRRIAEKQTGSFEIQFQIELNDTYDKGIHPAIRITRLTPESDDTISDRMDWSAISWIKRDQLSYEGVSTLALMLDSEFFSGRIPKIECDIKGRLIKVPSNYAPETRQYDGIWDGSFKLAYSNNPAWVIYDLLTDRDWGLGLSDHLVESFDLYTIARYSDGLVADGQGGQEPRFLFDAILSRRQSAHDLIQQICGTIHVMMFWSGGRLRFVQDKPADPVLWLTNHHVEDGQFIYTGASARNQISHALVSFINPDAGNEIMVEAETNPNILAAYGYTAQEVALLGCRRRSQARRHARWLLDKSDAELHSVSWRAGLDHFAANPLRPGDVVRIFDQRKMMQGNAGRLLVENAKVRFDQALPAGDYWADIETSSGWQENISIQINNDGILNPSEGAWPYPPTDQGAAFIKKNQHYGTEHSGSDYRVIAVRELDRHQLEIDAITHDNSRFDAIENNLILANPADRNQPDFTDPIAAPTGLVLEQPQAITGTERLRDMLISWSAPLDRRIAYWQIKAEGPEGEKSQITVTSSPAILKDLVTGEWTAEVYAVNWAGHFGKSATASTTINIDPSLPIAPKNPKLISEYGQLVLTWERGEWPEGAVVEVLEYKSQYSTKPLSIIASEGVTMIFTGRTPGVLAYFTLRTRLKGGSLSSETKRLNGAALAWPENPIMTTSSVTASAWSDDQAETAIQSIRGQDKDMIEGDIVTLNRKSPNQWAETRRYDGTSWEVVDAVLSGDALAADTVPASRLKLDQDIFGSADDDDRLTVTQVSADLITSGVLKSSDYLSKTSGFSIDTSGQAEFNDALIRGTLEGSRIEGSVLVSPLTIIPCQDYPEFFTLDQSRPVIARNQTHTHKKSVFGPFVIPNDRPSGRHGDGLNPVLAVNDPHEIDEGSQDYYSRFWSKQPIFIVTMDYTPLSPVAGALVKTGLIQFIFRTASGRIVEESNVFDLSKRSFWVPSSGHGDFIGLITWPNTFFSQSSIVMEHKISGTGNNRYTSGITMKADLEFDYEFQSSQPENDSLFLDVKMDFSASPISTTQQRSIHRALEISCETQS